MAHHSASIKYLLGEANHIRNHIFNGAFMIQNLLNVLSGEFIPFSRI
jgi:hypothetical membrane protein